MATTRLSEIDAQGLRGSKAARMLSMIRRDMDLKGELMRARLRNEEILSLSYHDGSMTSTVGGVADAQGLRSNALNLPYRYVRWLEAQATSKQMVVKVNRDAGEGQRPGGPADATTGMWTGIALARIAYEAGFKREIKSVMGEVAPRGTSVLRIGYHEQEISAAETAEVGKDPQSVIADVLGSGDVEAKPGQAHAEISQGLANMAQDPLVQANVGMEGVGAILERKASHDEAQFKAETKAAKMPKQSTRLLRHRIWMRKLRVGEDCGWSPYVYDVEDASEWWERHVWTVAEVKASSLFTTAFKRKVQGYDGRNVSGVARGGKTASTDSMGADARQAQTEDVLDDDEKMVEWFSVWIRRPDMKSGGIRKMVCAETPEDFIEADESNPHVNTETGEGLIPGFFPFYDFTPILPPLTIPERTCGVPLIGVGMTHFERICEYNRLLHESGLRHSLRLYEIHPSLKDNKRLQDALKNGEDGFWYVAASGQTDSNGKVLPGVQPIQFSGNTLEVDRLAAREESMWIKVMGMPPAVLQGVGTANTATQDQQGIAAGEAESSALIAYFEDRVADVLSGMRGLMRGVYDDEDFVRLLGEEGAAVMKSWQTGTVDDGDAISVAFGAAALADRTVRTKQVMEAINVLAAQVDPVTGMPKYDYTALLDELMRMLDVGGLKLDSSMLAQLQQLAMVGKQALMAQQAQMSGGPDGAKSPPGSPGQANKPSAAGPNPSEGEGPQQGTLAAGARRGTMVGVSG